MLAFSVMALVLSMISGVFGVAVDFEAAEAAPVSVGKRAATTLTAAQIAAFTPYTRFAGAAYCTPATTKAWNCGSEWYDWLFKWKYSYACS